MDLQVIEGIICRKLIEFFVCSCIVDYKGIRLIEQVFEQENLS